MDSLTTWSLLEFTNIVLTIAIMAGAFIAGRFATKRSEGKDAGKIENSLENINAGIGDIKKEQALQRGQIESIIANMAHLDEKVQCTQRRVDLLDQKGVQKS